MEPVELLQTGGLGARLTRSTAPKEKAGRFIFRPQLFFVFSIGTASIVAFESESGASLRKTRPVSFSLLEVTHELIDNIPDNTFEISIVFRIFDIRTIGFRVCIHVHDRTRPVELEVVGTVATST